MKEATKITNEQHKKRIHKPLFSIQDGWNLGIGFWLAGIALPFIILFFMLVFYFLFWVLMLLLG